MAGHVTVGKSSRDVIVVGGGVIGLSITMAAAKKGLRVAVIDGGHAGAASSVAAGLLAPSLGTLPTRAAAAFRAANKGYAEFLGSVQEASGHTDLALGKGILEIALAAEDVPYLNEAMDPAAIRMASGDVARHAPDVVPVAGAMLHQDDGWIEPRRLLGALTATIPAGALIQDRVAAVDIGADIVVRTESGERHRCGLLVIAAGSWSPLIGGLPARLPIVPARGEVIVIETTHTLPFAIACEGGYFVPRPGGIVVGSTFDFVGYDPRSTLAGRARLEKLASQVIPGAFARVTRTTSWAGLRPMTPDKLPIVDSDPADRRIVYSCGHGKNGLLLAGLTAEIVLDLLSGNRLEADSPFRLDRFKVK